MYKGVLFTDVFSVFSLVWFFPLISWAILSGTNSRTMIPSYWLLIGQIGSLAKPTSISWYLVFVEMVLLFLWCEKSSKINGLTLLGKKELS